MGSSQILLVRAQDFGLLFADGRRRRSCRSETIRQERDSEKASARKTLPPPRRYIRTYVSPPGQSPHRADDHRKPDYIPPFRPYELVHLTLDLILLARHLLVPKGRLVFFLPTVTEEYSDIDIPVVKGMRETRVGEGSVQDFGKWGRRVSLTCAWGTGQG